MSRITVIGAGFGALTAIRTLRKQLPTAELTLVAPRPEFVYYPSLIWMPSGLRKPEDLIVDLRPLLRRLDVQFHEGRVTGLSEDGRRVITEQGEIENDGLIIASGGRFIKKLPGIEHALTICEGIESTKRICERLDSLDGGTIAVGFGGNPKEPAAVRGGPMFELLFGIDRLLRQQGRRDRFRIVFFSAAKRPGNRLGDRAVDRLLARMAAHDIETHLGHKPQRFEADRVVTEGGEFPADLILFMPGLTGPAWLDETTLPRSPGGMIAADAHCRVDGVERVYVVGDSGSYPGPDWAPKQAHMADLQARAAASNLIDELHDRPVQATFRWELVCIMDMLDRGVLVFRNEKRQFVLPPCRLMHGAKRLFEWWYLRGLR
ncbi:MAG: NAD(P)/FAD-dependent oxidoreductase [Halothiobacillaceae bacterium]